MQQTPHHESLRNELISEIKSLIVDSVGLHHLNQEDIKPETSLKNGGLELDSVDILEVVVMVEQHFGIKVTDAETGLKYFQTIGSIADFVQLHKTKNEG